MRGTQRVGSLLRLLLCAAFLCVAWILLTSAQADAAERPASVGLVVSLARPVTTPVPVPASTPAPAPAPAMVHRDSAATVSGTSAAVVVPVVDRLRATTATTVSVAADGLKAVAAAVPVLEGPVVVLVDDVAALVDAVPVVGREPLVDAPLPDLPATPLPDTLPETDLLEPGDAASSPTNPVAKKSNPVSPNASSGVSRGLSLAVFDPVEPLAGPRTVEVNERTPLRSAAPGTSDAPGFPPQPAPMPPIQSIPNQGGGASSGDLASMGPALVLPNPTAGASGTSAWRVPRGLPTQPGIRPD